MDKKEIREIVKDKLINIAPDLREEITKNIAGQLFASKEWKGADTIGITVSGGFEWDTTSIIEKGWREGKIITVPKCIPEVRRLDFYQLKNFNQLEQSFFNLREPNPQLSEKVKNEDIDLLIVPGLGFDRRGYRVGFGGGYYDRFLEDFPNKTISIFYSEQLFECVPDESFDIPVQSLLTEKGSVKETDK